MKVRGKYERRQGAYKRLKKRIDSKKLSNEFLTKLPELVSKNNSTEEKEIEKYWKRRNEELSKLSSKGSK